MRDPVNIEAEQSVLGSMLTTARVINPVLAESGLLAEHFYLDSHRAIFTAIRELHEHGEPVDAITVAERCGIEREKLLAMAAKVPAPGHAAQHARMVIEKADLRRLQEAAKGVLEGIERGEESAGELIGEARRALDGATPAGDPYLSPAALADYAYQVADGGQGGETFPWPFDRLDALSGGIRTGQLVLIAGWTHHGKSAFAGQLLESVSSSGARACLYFNEMDAEEHIGGWLQRSRGIPSLDFVRGKLRAADQRTLTDALNAGFPFGMCPVAGWDAHKIAAHIRLHRWDVAVVDILHNIHYEDERDLSNAVTAFVEAAKLAECAVVLVAHLNRGRLQGAQRPLPSLRDLRGTGDLENKADIVCFVHREQDDTSYEPTAESQIFLAKCRGGRLGGFEARFDQDRIRFLPVDERFGSPPTLEAVA